MRNLFKKSLACCLALALCLTAMVGLTVSAAEVAGTITVGEVTVEPGTAEAKVDITLSAAGLSEAILNVSTDAGTITAVTSDDVSATLATNGIKMALYTEGDSSVDSATATITVALADTQTEKEYTVNVSIATAASVDENLINAEPASGKITVKAAHVHVTGYTNNENGTHTTKCTADGCDGTFVAATSDCTYVDGVCSACGYVKPVTGPTVDANLKKTLMSTGAMMASTFGINFQFTGLKPATFGGDSFEFRVTKNEFDTSNYTYKADPSVTVFTSADTTNPAVAPYGIYAFEYTFALYELKVPITYSIHIFKEGTEISYYAFEPTTLTDVAVARYEKASSGSAEDTKVRKMVVALLNVGTKVQEVFAAKTNTSEDSPLKTFEAPNKDVDTETYAVSYDTLESKESTKSGIVNKLSVAIDAAPTIHIEFFSAALKDAADTFHIEASYSSKFEGKTVTFEIPGTDAYTPGYGIYSYDFTGTYLFDTDKEVTLIVKQNDGTELGSVQCTIDSLLLQNVNAEGLSGEAYRAVAALAAHCRVFYPDF